MENLEEKEHKKVPASTKRCRSRYFMLRQSKIPKICTISKLRKKNFKIR